MEKQERRMFIGSKGQPSTVLRSKKGEPEDEARTRLSEKGWNLDAPHIFTANEDGTGEFRTTDPKIKKPRKPSVDKTPADKEPEEAPSTSEVPVPDLVTEVKATDKSKDDKSDDKSFDL